VPPFRANLSDEVLAMRMTLITGASGGIGLELAHVFARHGHPLILVARSAPKLARLANELQARYKVSVTTVPFDLAQLGAAGGLVDELARRNLTVDILVNNAGFGLLGSYLETDGDQEQEMIRLHIETLTDLTKRLLPNMVARGWGRVLNVASTAAFQPGPYMAVYYATKAFVLSYSEALHYELKGTGVSVTALCPGPTKSGFQAVAGFGEGAKINKLMMEARPVAELGYRGLMRGQAVVIPGLMNRVGVLGAKFLPRRLVTKFSAMIAQQFK
jgi:short-subunit dehydrogenase